MMACPGQSAIVCDHRDHWGPFGWHGFPVVAGCGATPTGTEPSAHSVRPAWATLDTVPQEQRRTYSGPVAIWVGDAKRMDANVRLSG
jgi:hypothetical protein